MATNRKPREWWLVVNPQGHVQLTYETLEMAQEIASTLTEGKCGKVGPFTVVPVREVLEANEKCECKPCKCGCCDLPECRCYCHAGGPRYP